MKQDPTRQLTILACSTGLLLAAIFFGALALQADTPDWLPMMISAIGGFEMYMFGRSLWLKRNRQGGR